MPAPDNATLYDFETQMEAAWQSVFQEVLASTGVKGVYVTRDEATLDTPRVEVEFITGSALNQRKYFAGPPRREVPNAFTGVLVVRVVTTRAIAENRAEHGNIRGILRFNMTSEANKIKANTNLPYLQVLDLLPSGSTPRIIDEKEQDSTEMQYAMQFAIVDSAWPS